MASSAYIWKNKEDVSIYKTIRDVKLAAKRSGNQARIDSKIACMKDYMYTEGSVANIYEYVSWARSFVIYIYEYSYCFDFGVKTLVKEGRLPAENDMSQVIYIEDTSDCEPVLSHFLFEYLKLNPKDVFCPECYNWYFTYEDIERIVKKRRVDNSWYCKDPALRNVDYWENHIEINGNVRNFECKIMKVQKQGNQYIVQHGSGYDTGIRNIYCLDEHANIVWQFENLFECYPDAEKQGINNMQIKNGVIIATDFSRKNEYHINIETGEAEKQIRWVNGEQEIIPYPFSDNIR